MTEELRPPPSTTVSIKPAMSVLVIAAVTLVFFLSLNLVASPRSSSPTTFPVVVGGLQVDSANRSLRGCQLPGNPPTDIVTGLLVPVGTITTQSNHVRGSGAGEFDCTAELTVNASQAEILGFYESELTARAWKLFSRQSSVNAQHSAQFLFQKAGSDTFYWIEGITITSAGSGKVSWTLRLYQGTGLI